MDIQPMISCGTYYYECKTQPLNINYLMTLSYDDYQNYLINSFSEEADKQSVKKLYEFVCKEEQTPMAAFIETIRLLTGE